MSDSPEDHQKLVFLRDLREKIHRLWGEAYNRLSDEGKVVPALDLAFDRVSEVLYSNELQFRACGDVEPIGVSFLEASDLPKIPPPPIAFRCLSCGVAHLSTARHLTVAPTLAVDGMLFKQSFPNGRNQVLISWINRDQVLTGLRDDLARITVDRSRLRRENAGLRMEIATLMDERDT